MSYSVLLACCKDKVLGIQAQEAEAAICVLAAKFAPLGPTLRALKVQPTPPDHSVDHNVALPLVLQLVAVPPLVHQLATT